MLECAVRNVFGKPNKESSVLTMGIEDGTVPEWVTALKPVVILPTNFGSRIWFCVHEVLKKDPPEWEKKELENYIAKDVYKGNASGPTKVKFHYTVSLHCCFLHLLSCMLSIYVLVLTF